MAASFLTAAGPTSATGEIEHLLRIQNDRLHELAEALQGLKRQLDLLTLTTTVSTGATFIENPEAVVLADPGGGARPQQVFEAKDQAYLVRAFAIGYGGGSILITRGTVGGDTVARSADSITSDSAHSYIVLRSGRLFALGPSGGVSTLVISATPLSKVSQ